MNTFRYLLLVLALGMVLTGCFTVSENQPIVEGTAPDAFAGHTIAVLPVKAQTSLAPDSVLAIRNEINKKLGQSLRAKLTSSTVLDITVVADSLNQNNALSALDQLESIYDNTGVVDKRQTSAIGVATGSDYILFSRLKAEKMDLSFFGKGTGASLEAMLIDTHTGGIRWGGSGEWKRGGAFGFGGAPADQAATNLITLALTSLPQATGSRPPPPVATVSSDEDEQKPAAKRSKRRKKR